MTRTRKDVSDASLFQYDRALHAPHALYAAAGRDRMDLMIDYGGRRNIIEIKLVHPKRGRKTTLSIGLEQIARYDNTVVADTLHLVIFDRRPEYRAKPWEERLSREARTTAVGKPVTIVWC